MAKVKSETAQSIRECLGYLLQEAVEGEMNLVALHIRLAMAEADDVMAAAITRETGRKRTGKRGGNSSREGQRARP